MPDSLSVIVKNDPAELPSLAEIVSDFCGRNRLAAPFEQDLNLALSMHQAANLGDRLIMMHRGRIIHDFRGPEKRRLRADDLLARFEDVRRADQLDETAAEMLQRVYV